ncbi:MAG TPA: transglutaminase domain-containing protein [Desulfuromonadales bacterium]|nr:transglutaminase domain-containing protein [Desulfuromonadales bacterium]
MITPRILPIVVSLLLILPVPAIHAKTLLLTGHLFGEADVSEQLTFGVDQNVTIFSYRFPIPASQKSAGINQRLVNHTIQADPKPATQKDETDSYGNHFKVLTWKNLNSDARLTVSFGVAIDADLTTLSSRAPFPVSPPPSELRPYLKPTKLVQSDDSEISAKARDLVTGAASQAAAVESILNFVSDHIRYETPPKSYDALFGLTTGTGNCQNFAHLSAALLRSVGIPARIAVGLTLKEKWKVPVGNDSFIVQGMGEGLHAWLEVWFPDLGWLPCDPQQSRQFTSTRHIKYSHGPECIDLGSSWSGSPVVPHYSSVLSSSFSRDDIDLRLNGTSSDPRGYIVSNQIKSSIPAPLPVVVTPIPEPLPVPVPVIVPKPKPDPVIVTRAPRPPKPVPAPKALPEPKPKPVPEKITPVPLLPQPLPQPEPIPKPEPKPVAPAPLKAGKDSVIVFGNLRLPGKLAFFTEQGNRGEASLERETAEYVTAPGSVYAQAFTVEQTMRLSSVALGMKKFGGDGTVYLDIVADENGKPGLTNGIRTQPISLERIKRIPGYGWLEFPIPEDTAAFKAGKYWIVLRRSGDAIMNWYFTPGKPYGGADDTRSTARGWQWEDILMFDFVFKVTGRNGL